MHKLIPLLLIALILPFCAMAQTAKEPQPPKTLADLERQGSQLFYLGKYEGMNGWALIRQGRPEFFYENPERTAMVMGMMFDGDGQMITMSQLSALKEKYGDEMYATTSVPVITDDNANADLQTRVSETGSDLQPANGSETVTSAVQPSSSIVASNATAPQSAATPMNNRAPTQAERMYADLITANWVTLNPQ